VWGQDYVAVKWIGSPSAFKAMGEFIARGQQDNDEAAEVRRTIWTHALREQHSRKAKPGDRRKELEE